MQITTDLPFGEGFDLGSYSCGASVVTPGGTDGVWDDSSDDGAGDDDYIFFSF